MAIKYIIVLFVETPRKFITAKLSIPAVSPDLHIISTDEDPGLRIESFACSNKFTWCFHKQNYYIFYIISSIYYLLYNIFYIISYLYI
jgi:hypothetical protein